MLQAVNELEALIPRCAAQFRGISEDALSARPAPDKWSQKQLIGHLIDSAQNNIRRLVQAQYENRPHIVYNQDQWVALQHYDVYPAADLITLWELLNRHLCLILKQMPAAHYHLLCNTGKNGEELHSLAFLAEDYVAHLKHHLQQFHD